MNKKETMGKIATDLMKKNDGTVSAIDQTAESLSEWDRDVAVALSGGKSKYDHDFYLVIETKKEKLLHNILRNFMFTRSTCPTPNYDQTVFLYHYKSDTPEFLWVVPSRDTCLLLLFVQDYLTEEQDELLGFVRQFASGNLLKKCKKLNGEEQDSTLLIKG